MSVALGQPGILSTIGGTPLVELTRLVPRTSGSPRVLLKCEFFNPLFSVKDRIGRAMIESAERQGVLVPGLSHIVESTSGNTGIALAFVAAAKGYRLTLTMPDTMSQERRALLRALGAELVLTPGSAGIRGAIARAHELLENTPNAWVPRQFDNPANPQVHEETTGPEIWSASEGAVDVVVAGVGTGGTITGVTRYLRTHKPKLLSYAVEPADSPVIAQKLANQALRPGPHRIQGIGAGFIPRNLDLSLLSGVEHVTNEEAFAWARRLALEEGIVAGISTGANLAVAARLAGRPEFRGKTIVTFACSSGERYLSTPLFDLVGMQSAPDATASI